MLTTELLETLDHPIAAAMVDSLAGYAATLSEISAEIDSADDSDQPTFTATLAKLQKLDAEKAAAYDTMVANVKAARAAIYYAVNGFAEKDSDRTVAIQNAKDAYYAARRMAVLIETVCEVDGFVNAYLGTLDLPEGAGLRKSMKNVK